MSAATTDPPPGKPPVSRRTLLGAVLLATAGLAAVGIPTVTQLLASSGSSGSSPQPPLFARRGGTLLSPLLTSRPFSIAHRGGSDDWPEMSLYAYTQSVKLGINALEISLARTSDGVWFGLHDESLDRTSGTSGFIASEHSWAAVNRHRISPVVGKNGQTAQPYLRFTDLLTAFGDTHVIFVDPKFVSPRYLPELLGIMARGVTHPTQTFVAKSLGSDENWGALARSAGYRTFGFYYASRGDANLDNLAATHHNWDLLGMQFDGGAEAWAAARSFGKPVIGHIVADRAAAQLALGNGAVGVIASGVAEVLPAPTVKK